MDWCRAAGRCWHKENDPLNPSESKQLQMVRVIILTGGTWPDLLKLWLAVCLGSSQSSENQQRSRLHIYTCYLMLHTCSHAFIICHVFLPFGENIVRTKV